MAFDINKVAAKLDVIRQRKEAELQKLCEQPELFDVAQALADELIASLNHLFNYRWAKHGDGKGRTDIQEVYDELRKGIVEVFENLTGRPYQPTICRNIDFAKKNPQQESKP